MHLKNILAFSEQKSRRQQIGKNKGNIIMCLECICKCVLMWKCASISSTSSSLSCPVILRVRLQIPLTLFLCWLSSCTTPAPQCTCACLLLWVLGSNLDASAFCDRLCLLSFSARQVSLYGKGQDVLMRQNNCFWTYRAQRLALGE